MNSSDQMRHALFVAYHYPPEASSSGVLRTLKYTRHLVEHGWRVTVLTLRRDAYGEVDASLERQIPEAVRVVRTGYINTKRHLSLWGRYPSFLAVPDRWIGWYPWAVRAARRLYAEDPFELVYSTSPHATTHIIAGSISNWSGVPWVMDFRDPWYEEPPEPGTPAIVHWMARRLERRAISRARFVVTSTSRLQGELVTRYPQQRGKIRCIFNGYDEADFAALPEPKLRGDGILRVVHAGSINAEFRDPTPLLRALRRASDEGGVELQHVYLRFIGPGPYADSPAMTRAVQELGLGDNIEFVARVPYAEALQQIADADVLLLLQASADTVGLVPAKLYEYVRAGHPVLAAVWPGITADVLRETEGGWAVDPRDESALVEAWTEIYRGWRAGDLMKHAAPRQRLERYSRRSLAAELAALFDTAAAAGCQAGIRRGPSTPW